MKLNMWIEKSNKLTRSFHFSDFAQAFSFMTEVAQAAESQNHHPFWSNNYNIVVIELSTHEAGNSITEKDKTLALAIDEIWDHFEK